MRESRYGKAWQDEIFFLFRDFELAKMLFSGHWNSCSLSLNACSSRQQKIHRTSNSSSFSRPNQHWQALISCLSYKQRFALWFQRRLIRHSYHFHNCLNSFFLALSRRFLKFMCLTKNVRTRSEHQKEFQFLHHSANRFGCLKSHTYHHQLEADKNVIL